MICELHGQFFNEGQMCGTCWREGIIKVKAEKKTLTNIKFKKPIKLYKNKKRTALKNKLQSLVSKQMKDYYKNIEVYYCWISGKSTMAKGLFSLHVSHYYAKSEIWQLWADPVNCGLSSYNENVNKPQTVTQMRAKMIEVWGLDAVNDLDKRAEDARNRIKMGIDPRYPTDLWILAKIKDLNNNNIIK